MLDNHHCAHCRNSHWDRYARAKFRLPSGSETDGAGISVVLAVISIVGQVLVTQSRTPGVVPLHFVKFSTPYLTLSCATSQLTTALIAVRIFQVQREFKSIGSQPFHRRSHAKVVEIIVESAVIYSVNLLVFVVLTAMKSINLSYPQNIHPQIAVRNF